MEVKSKDNFVTITRLRVSSIHEKKKTKMNKDSKAMITRIGSCFFNKLNLKWFDKLYNKRSE